MNTNERRRLREQYNMLVNRMASSQRMRINAAYPPGMSNTQSGNLFQRHMQMYNRVP